MKKLLPFFSDFTNGKQSPTENSYRSCHFSGLANNTEEEQDLKGEVYVVDMPPDNSSKEEPGPVEPEQKAHTNNNRGEPLVKDPAEHLRDQVDDLNVHRRNNKDGPPAEAPGGETEGKRHDAGGVPLQDRSGDGSLQGQGNERRRSSFPPDLPKKVENPPVKRSTSVLNQLQPAGRQRKFGLGNSQFCHHVLSAVNFSSIFLHFAKKQIKKNYVLDV